MEQQLESAKTKLAHAKKHGTGVVLEAAEAAALYSVVGSMSMIDLKGKPNQIIAPPEPLICTACYGSGYYDSCDANGNNIRCGNCNGEGTVSEY